MSLLERIENGRGRRSSPASADPGRRRSRLSLPSGSATRSTASPGARRFHSLRLRGRFPLKLLAVPKDPIAGDKAAGEAMLDGWFVHGGERPRAKELDFADPRASARIPIICRASPGCATSPPPPPASGRAWPSSSSRLAAAMPTRSASAPGGRPVGPPHPLLAGLRALHPVLEGHGLPLAVLNTLARGARHLERSADKAPPGLPRITAWAGVIAAALVVQGGPARLGKGEAGCSARAAQRAARRWRPRQPLADRAARAGRAARPAARRLLCGARHADCARRGAGGSVAALLAVTLGDEALSSWQGGNMLTAAASPPRSKAPASRPGRSARRAAGAISGCRPRTACCPRRRAAAAEPAR
jgi:hypothetical protein